MNWLLLVSILLFVLGFGMLSQPGVNQLIDNIASMSVLLGILLMIVGFFKSIKDGIRFFLMLTNLGVLIVGVSKAIEKIETWGLLALVGTLLVVTILYSLQKRIEKSIESS